MGLLRLLLAFCVLASHHDLFELEFLPGDLAVRTFFVISGYYMAFVLERKYAGRPVRLFYTNRLLRLYPGYALMAVFSLAALLLLDVHPFAGQDQFRLVFGNAASALAVVWANIAIFGQEILFLFDADKTGALWWCAGAPHAAGAYRFMLVPQGWSLALELYFYLLAPWLLRLSTSRLGLLAAASFALNLGMIASGQTGADVCWRFLPAQLYLFLLGCLAFRLTARGERAWLRGRPLVACAGLLAALILGFEYLPLPLGLRVAALLGLTAAVMPGLFDALSANRFDRLAGDLSYPFYICHFLIVAFVEAMPDPPPDALILLSTLGLAGTLLFLERPLHRVRQRRVTAAPVLLPAPATAATAAMVAAPAMAAAVTAAVADGVKLAISGAVSGAEHALAEAETVLADTASGIAGAAGDIAETALAGLAALLPGTAPELVPAGAATDDAAAIAAAIPTAADEPPLPA